MSEQIDLKDCPFCGGKVKLQNEVKCFGHGEFITVHFVLCDSCGVRSRAFAEDYEKEPVKLAVNNWNRRIKE